MPMFKVAVSPPASPPDVKIWLDVEALDEWAAAYAVENLFADSMTVNGLTVPPANPIIVNHADTVRLS